MSNIHNISNYKSSPTETYLFDNNVWMFLFGSIASYSKDKKQKLYSAFFTDLISSKRTIIINSLILSEFSNAYLRLEFEHWKKLPANAGKTSYKKDFVGSAEFNEIVDEVKINIKKILTVAEKFSDSFNSIDFDNVLASFGDSDFNDSYYIELARKFNYKIVSDDSDLLSKNVFGVDIITANI